EPLNGIGLLLDRTARELGERASDLPRQLAREAALEIREIRNHGAADIHLADAAGGREQRAILLRAPADDHARPAVEREQRARERGPLRGRQRRDETPAEHERRSATNDDERC